MAEGLMKSDIVTVRAGEVDVRFALPSNVDHISKVIRATGDFYERPFLDALAPVLSPGDFVVDVGANIGNHSLYFAKLLRCNVIAFEPVETTLECLLHNVEINFADSYIEVRPFAVGSAPGQARITTFDESNLGATSLVQTEDGDLPLTSLDNESFGGRVSLIKIDVEGMDLEVIRGALALIERDRPFISCELNDPAELRALEDILETIDYVCLGVYNATPTYVLAPARTAPEQAAIVRFQGQQLQAIKDLLKELDIRLLRSNRYTERLHREALQEINSRMAPGDSHAGKGAPVAGETDGNEIAEIRGLLEELRSLQESSSRRIAELENEISELRGNKQ
jgi:FkbM family methyltransferase